jgi:hypothetical protein
MYSPFESKALVIGGLLVVLGYIFKGKDPQMIMYFWYFCGGYIIFALFLTIRAYCRHQKDKQLSAREKLLDLP